MHNYQKMKPQDVMNETLVKDNKQFNLKSNVLDSIAANLEQILRSLVAEGYNPGPAIYDEVMRIKQVAELQRHPF